MYKQERTCTCISNITIPAESDCLKELVFHKGREYQVDVYPLYYQIYQNGGWNDYVFQTDEEFNKNFKLIG